MGSSLRRLTRIGLAAAALILAVASLPASAGMALDEPGIEDAGGARRNRRGVPHGHMVWERW